MILASVCMRGGSKGVPGKNARNLNGKPLLEYTFECLRGVDLVDHTVVSTDDKAIMNLCEHFVEKKYIYERPAELATDHASKWDVFRHLVERFERENKERVELLVDLDVTVPLRRPEYVDGAIRMLADRGVDVVITGYEPERNPYFNMMEIGEDGVARIVKRTETPIVCRQEAPKVFSLSPAVYVMTREALFDYEHWSQARCTIYEIPRAHAVDIDTPLDFDWVEYLMKKENES